jgi:hypothetical protein
MYLLNGSCEISYKYILTYPLHGEYMADNRTRCLFLLSDENRCMYTACLVYLTLQHISAFSPYKQEV